MIRRFPTITTEAKKNTNNETNHGRIAQDTKAFLNAFRCNVQITEPRYAIVNPVKRISEKQIGICNRMGDGNAFWQVEEFLVVFGTQVSRNKCPDMEQCSRKNTIKEAAGINPNDRSHRGILMKIKHVNVYTVR